VLGSNPCKCGTLDYVNRFTRDGIHECRETSIGFPRKVFLVKKH
jgi:hypothetical protein